MMGYDGHRLAMSTSQVDAHGATSREMAYILKITGEYFENGLGWPLALVLAGLMLMAVGYLYVYLRKKYALA